MNFKKLTEHSLELIPKKPAKHLIEDGLKTFPMYLGKKHSIKEVVNADGTVNIKNAKKIMEDVASYFGGKKMQNRAENPVWHKTDPNTWLHTKLVTQNAWQIPVPEGYTKQDLMVAALGHDFGKMLSGDGHAEVSYNLLKLIFPDATEKQLNAIRKHMDDLGTHSDLLEQATKFADIGITPKVDLINKKDLTPEELEIVRATKWFKKGGTIQNIVTLYHNCPKSALSSILKNGIKASYSINKNNLTHKEIADKVKKIPKVVYLGNKRMADGIGAYRKKHGYSKDDGVTLELKIPKKDYDNFKFVDNPECLGAKNLAEYIKIHKSMNSKISENELKQRWKVINPPYTITIANDIDPKYIVNKFKIGGNLKLVPKAEGGRKLLTKVFNDVFKGKTLKELSPQEWDKAYNFVLLKYGNKESNLLQKIRDYHFYTAAPDTIVKETSGKPLQVFHGSVSPNIREFSLDTPNNASMTNVLDKRIYFSDSKGIAALYAVDPEYKLALTIDHLADAVGLDREGLEIIAYKLEMPIKDVKKIVKDYKIGMNFVMRKTNQDDFIYPVYLNMRKHADVDLNGDIISRLSKEARAEINSKPGAIIRNVDETVTNLFGMRTAPSTDYLVLYPQQIKRSAAITYDTNGNIIPISQRDNFHNPDINYKVGGKLIPKNSKGNVLESLQEIGEKLIKVSLEKLAQRAKNNENALEIYRKRLLNGGEDLVKNRGTLRYAPKNIVVKRNLEDLEKTIAEMEKAEHSIPIGLTKDLELELEAIRFHHHDKGFSPNKTRKKINEFYLRHHLASYEDAPDIKELADYVLIPDSPRLSNWKTTRKYIGYENGLGFNTENFVWAPNKKQLEQFGASPDFINYFEAILPHEFEHAFLNGDKVYEMFNPENAIAFLKLILKGLVPKKDLLAMQKEMSKLIGIDPSKITNADLSIYLTLPTELLARGTQIKNWLGITNPHYKLTANDLKEAAKYYTSTGFDNNMSDFFSIITDWDKAADFLSKATIATGAVAGVGTSAAVMTSLDKPTLISKKGGKL